MDALDTYGEHYTAARLMADLLVRIEAPAAAEALASAAALSGSRVG